VFFRAKVIQGWSGEIGGEVLITKSKISFLGDIDMNTGMVVGKDLDIQGEYLQEKIFIFPEGRGSTVGSNVLFGLAKRGLSPKLMGTCRAELITISGAIMGGIPMISELRDEVFDVLKTGDRAKVLILDDGYAYVQKL